MKHEIVFQQGGFQHTYFLLTMRLTKERLRTQIGMDSFFLRVKHISLDKRYQCIKMV